MVRDAFWRAHGASIARLAGDPRRARRPDLGTDGLRQDAGGVPAVPGRSGPARAARPPAGSDPGSLRFSAEGLEQRRSQESGTAAGGDPRTGGAARHYTGSHSHGVADGRYAPVGPPADDARAPAYPGDHAGVALHPADRSQAPRNAGAGPDLDRR